MTAHIFLRIFGLTTRLSKYLQTGGIDLLTAKRLISNTEVKLSGDMRRDFDGIKVATDNFVQWAIDNIESTEFDHGQKTMLHVQTELPKKRLEPNPLGTYRVDVFNVITDMCVSSLKQRYTPETLRMLKDLSLVDPHGFSAIVSNGMQAHSLRN